MANQNPKQPDGVLAYQAGLYGFEFLQALHEAGRRLAEIKKLSGPSSLYPYATLCNALC